MAASRDDIVHLLRRTEFVARPARVAELAGRSLAAAVDDVLDVRRNRTASLPSLLRQHRPNQVWQQWVAATQWWLDRMVTVPRPFHERLTLFWHGHFTSSWWKVGRTDAMVNQNQLYRRDGLGDYRLLAQRMAIEPAMLLYLDNATNVAGDENQNFARELLELFLLGVGNYTEADVETAAKAWTGHTVNWSTYRYVFRRDLHDSSVQSFMGVQRQWDGPALIDFLLRDNTTTRTIAARWLARKLWEFFAHDGPSEALVAHLADEFVASGLRVRALVRAILTHPDFYSARSRTGSVRSPIELLVAIMEATGLRSAQLHPEWFVEAMGQVPFDPPNVSGWRRNSYWVNTSSFTARAELARHVTWMLRRNDRFADLATLPISDAIGRIEQLFRLAPLSSTTRTAITGWMEVERAAEPWGGWWQPTNLLTMAMLTPEFHLS